MNIHELTAYIVGEERAIHGEEYQVHRLLQRSARVTGYDPPGTGNHVEVNEHIARFIALLYLLREDSPSFGRSGHLSTDDMVDALETAKVMTAESGEFLVLEFRGTLHSATVVADMDLHLYFQLPDFGELDKDITAWRIVRIP